MARRIEQLESEQLGPPREVEAARRMIADLESAVSEIKAARDEAIEEKSGLQRRLDAAEAEARTASTQAATLVAQLRDAQAVNELSGQASITPSPKAAAGVSTLFAAHSPVAAPDTTPPPLPARQRREPGAQQMSPPSLSPTGPTEDRRRIIEAMAFVGAVPCLLVAAAFFFHAANLQLLSPYGRGERSGWLSQAS
jgi:hypothetical protein